MKAFRSVWILIYPVCLILMLSGAWAQQTTGGIQGIARDSSGGILAGITVTITDPGTGREIIAVTNNAGLFSVRSLPAGDYEVRASLAGFKTEVRTMTVPVGRVVTADFVLQVGEINQMVLVQGVANQVDTATAVVQGTITAQEIRGLPLNGRNFLDLAQTEPGVQLVDGGSFDPTKNQMVGVSIGGRSGRVTRITVDEIDITDETVGTTTQNLSLDAVQEFQISQSSLDPSTSLTSSGAVNIITKRSSNEFHGSGFIFYRDEELAALPTTRTGSPETIRNLESAEFDRQQGGFYFGGPLVKDRLFFFMSYEKLNQDGTTFVSNGNFPSLNAAVTTPFNDNLGLGRLDFQVNDSMSAFLRFSHETNNGATGFGGVNLAPFVNQNVSNILATGFDIAAATLTHSFRFGYASFDNEISTNNLGLPEYVAQNGVAVSLALNRGNAFLSGPNYLAPQATYQTNQQYKYNGAWVKGRHALRYGAEVNWIQGNLFASFFGVGPEVRGTFSSAARQEIIDRGGESEDPMEYPVQYVLMGNGQGAFTEIANQGRSSGGINNTRIALYAADSWRIFPSFNLNLGIRWEVDTGQVNDDLALPQELSTILGPEGVRPTRLDKNNFGPQAGFAWQPFGNGRTVIRGGAGIYYETNIFNNAIFDRTNRLPYGLGFQVALPPLMNIDSAGRVLVSGEPVNDIDTRNWSGQPFKNVIDQIAQTQLDYQRASAGVPFDPGNDPIIKVDATTSLGPIFVQDYSTPYGFQTNIGIEHELHPNWILSVDYSRNRNIHHNIVRDFNRVGAADTLDAAGASVEIASVLSSNGLSSIDEAISKGMSITDFQLGGFFRGVDPNFGNINVIMSSGISTYRGLQTRLVARMGDVIGLKNVYTNVSYSLSRFDGMSADQDFIPQLDFNDGYMSAQNRGPAGLDRTHQIGLQLLMEIPCGFNLNLNSRWATGFPQNLLVPLSVGGADEIFFTDFNGDGDLGATGHSDFLPGAKRGDFGRRLDPSELNEVIQTYNNSIAGQITPAGKALVSAGLFTEAQLKALGAVAPTMPLAPAGQVMNDSFITQDIRISKSFTMGGERIAIEPMVEIFNLFNVANFGGPAHLVGFYGTQSLSGELTGSPGSINGTVPGQRTALFGVGSGAFSQGIPRSIQFGVRVDF